MFFTKRKRKKRKSSPLLLLLLGGAVFTASVTFGVYHYVLASSQEQAIAMYIDPNVGVKTQVEEFFIHNDAEEMLDIIKCESRFRHYEADGSVLKNKEGSSAIGVAQILSSQHPDPKIIYRFNKRNNTNLSVTDFDITTLEGNIGYALVLYTIRGTKDWECSKKFRF